MPHIIASAGNIDMNINEINIDLEIQFSWEYYQKQKKVFDKMIELKSKIEELLGNYFDDNDIEVNIYTNHEYNELMFGNE